MLDGLCLELLKLIYLYNVEYIVRNLTNFTIGRSRVIQLVSINKRETTFNGLSLRRLISETTRPIWLFSFLLLFLLFFRTRFLRIKIIRKSTGQFGNSEHIFRKKFIGLPWNPNLYIYM